MKRDIKIAIAATLLCIGVVIKILFFQKSYWYETPDNGSRVAVESYILAADVSAGSGHLKTAMVNLWVQHQDENTQTAIDISISCEVVKLVVDGVEVKPDNPSTCRDGAGATRPSAYLLFTLPVQEPNRIILKIPSILIRTQNTGSTFSPPISIAYYKKSKRISAVFH